MVVVDDNEDNDGDVPSTNGVPQYPSLHTCFMGSRSLSSRAFRKESFFRPPYVMTRRSALGTLSL